MTSRDPIPPLLTPYIRVPSEDSLTLCTSVLGALNNWVLLRYLRACLGDKTKGRDGQASDNVVKAQDIDNVSVVLVSWMRDFAFWQTETRRSMGLDLAKLQQQGRFAFIDGLIKLFDSTPPSSQPSYPPNRPSTPPPSAPSQQSTPAQRCGEHYLLDPSLCTLEATVKTALSSLSSSRTRTILILDTPTLPLSISPSITAQDLSNTLLKLRSHPSIHACILSLPVDDPFIAPPRNAGSSSAASCTPLETKNAALVAQLTQQARFVLSCRRLGTGWARDVSGVVRVTRGGCADEGEGVEGGEGDEGQAANACGKGEEMTEGEWLYHVGGDGGVRVWARGAEDGG